ncbi:MHYT domain-containing protein [Tepidimonas sp.]|uniref:MHYT domain-containing protein n=1 Tax=Tepidimonas sp. TaxID=2002775 RepID=UPI00391B3ACC
MAPVVYDPWLVALSLLIACAGGIAALQLVSLARRADRFGPAVARGSYALASLSLGVSVWAMHFIGMLAADLCQPVRYDPWITALSMLPSVAASAIGLRLYARPGAQGRPGVRAVVVAGVWVGAGIGAMHYSGMGALRIASTLRYDPAGFALSIVVAVGLAVAGLGAREWLRRHTRLPGLAVIVVAGCILGLATSGMHYTAMQASLFIGPVDLAFPRWVNRQFELAVVVAVVVAVTFGFAWGLLGIATYRALSRRLSEREALLSDILNHLPGAIVRLRTDGGFERLLVSPSLAELTGQSLESYQRGEWSLLDLVHPEDRAAVTRVIPDRRPSFYQTELQVRVRHATQGWRQVRVRAVAHDFQPDPRRRVAPIPVLDLYLTDVTEEHEARERERALLAAIDNVVGRAVLTPDGTFLEVNARLAGLLGYAPQELAGRAHRVVWTDEAQQADMAAFWAALRHGEAQPGEFARRAKDGRTVHLSGWYQPMFDAEGCVRSVLKLVFDVTERVHMVQALQRTQNELQQALTSRSAFFANVSHEIRTPMNTIVGFAELLRERLPDGSAEREQARTVLESARALLRILNDLLDAAKLERGEFRIAPAPFRLDRLLHDLVSQFGVLAARKGLDLRLEAAATLPRCWHGDGDRVRQILTNLLGNALKFTERGGVTLGATVAGEFLLLWVEDSGIGIPPERQRVVFDPFVQADEGTARRYGGTGLGMSIVQRLTELMGGQVALSSEVGVGTRVEVRLPLPVLPDELCAEPTDRTDETRQITAPLRVLAADDVAQNRELLALLLERERHRVTVVEDGAALLARYQAAPQTWDVLLLDLHMPGLDGVTACERLRAWERAQGLPPVPVLALSASVLEADRAAAQRAGMDGFLDKPIDPAALRRALAEVARRRHAPAASGQAAGAGQKDASVADAAAPRADTPQAGSPDSGLPPAVAGAAPDAASPSASASHPPVADPARGHALWGEAWLAQLHRWHAEQAAAWTGAAGWGRAEWHRVAGAAANLALPALAQAARAGAGARARRGARPRAGRAGLAGVHRLAGRPAGRGRGTAGAPRGRRGAAPARCERRAVADPSGRGLPPRRDRRRRAGRAGRRPPGPRGPRGRAARGTGRLRLRCRAGAAGALVHPRFAGAPVRCLTPPRSPPTSPLGPSWTPRRACCWWTTSRPTCSCCARCWRATTASRSRAAAPRRSRACASCSRA